MLTPRKQKFALGPKELVYFQRDCTLFYSFYGIPCGMKFSRELNFAEFGLFEFRGNKSRKFEQHAFERHSQNNSVMPKNYAREVVLGSTDLGCI